jgi:hypothetical protein
VQDLLPILAFFNVRENNLYCKPGRVPTPLRTVRYVMWTLLPTFSLDFHLTQVRKMYYVACAIGTSSRYKQVWVLEQE